MINQSRGDVYEGSSQNNSFHLVDNRNYRSSLERVYYRMGQKCYYYVRLSQRFRAYSLSLYLFGDRKTEGFIAHLITSCG